jgi:2-polyprenyl-6-methoxyphenol hydroxylase-like FAD-dependent oxidoreductase
MTDGPHLRVLICGGGIAGPALAYWLSRIPYGSGINIIILERSPSARTTGQAVDIRGPAVKIMRDMGLEAEVRRRKTPEQGMCSRFQCPRWLAAYTLKGIEILGWDGKPVAIFGSSGDASQQSFTSEFEILRADLARVLVDTAKRRPDVRIVYGDYISAISQSVDGSGPAYVEFANGKLPTSDYDLVIAADGTLSHTRGLAKGVPADVDAHPIGGYNIAYFTVPRGQGDSPSHARYYAAPGSRGILVRPSAAGTGALFMFHLDGDAPRNVDAQKALVASIFDGIGWDASRLLTEMAQSDDFYFQRLLQVKCARWSIGRVGLLGDAACAAFTGTGTGLALYGAYILAGELGLALRDGRDVPSALACYDTVARPYIESVTKSPLGATKLLLPHSRWGVQVLHTVAALVYQLGLPKLFMWIGSFVSKQDKDVLPEYDWADEH